ncbi:MAG: 50S ribosomal protein L4 [Halobacteria archaeon]|nr:50S ribosomal protein L4 [Halobacteria archaeon]
MEADVYTVDGEKNETVDLPDAFEEEYRPDIIRRAFHSAEANAKQPYGADPFAGKRTSAESWGKGRGAAQVPRVKNSNTAARSPHVVGGRRAHPPKAEKNIGEDINDKERKKAVRSAVAATADTEVVAERGHEFDESLDLPVVLDAGFEDLVKTQEVVDVLKEIGLYDDIERADDRKVRAGQGTTRGRKYRRPKSILFVTAKNDYKASRNLAGADVVSAEDVDVRDLAPGGVGGRLTVWTEKALEVLDER